MLCVLPGIASPQQPDPLESLLASARDAQARSDFQAAAEFYRQAASLDPENAELRTNLGLMYYQTGKDQQAIEAFSQAIRLKPGLFVPNLFLGLDYLRLKRFNEAIPYLKRAARLKVADPQAQLALGQTYTGIGKTHLATDSYLRLVQLDPKNADGWFHLGVGYLEQVESDARILLARHRKSVYLQALVAQTFSEQGAFIQASDAYKQVLAFAAFPPETHASYGFVLLNRHDLSGAEREFNAERTSNPGSLMARLGLARLHIEQGAAARGVKEIAEIWKVDAGFVRANASLVTVGLPGSKGEELQRELEAQQASGDVSQEIVTMFQREATNENLADLSESLDLGTGGSIPVSKAPVGSAAELYASGRYEECSDMLASRLRMLRTKEIELLARCAYSTGNFRTAFDAAAKLAVDPATEAEGLYWETRSSQRLATQVLARASQIDSSFPQAARLTRGHLSPTEVFPGRRAGISKSPGSATRRYRRIVRIAPWHCLAIQK